MERFKITAVDPRSGRTIEGFLDGDSPDAVRALAEQRGLEILTIESLGEIPQNQVMAAVATPAAQASSGSVAVPVEAAAGGISNKNDWTNFAGDGHFAKRKHRAVIPSLPDPVIPITPMLDMTFQLLFFFIMTFRSPSGEETEIPFSLPPTDDKQTATQSKEPPPAGDTPPKFEANLTLVLRSNEDGDLRRVEISGSGAGDSLVIPEEDLRNHAKVGDLINRELVAKLNLPFLAHFGDDKTAAKSRAGINIKLQASSGIKWEMVVLVIDACRATAHRVADDPSKAVIALQKPIDQAGR